MSSSSWFPWRLARQYKGRTRPPHSQTVRRRSTRLTLEQLEDRTVPSNFTAATVSDLIADINAANALGGSNTITLVSGKTFTLTEGIYSPEGPRHGLTGLPAITATDNLTIQGNGDTILRSATAPAFRLLDVAAGAALTLENLTLIGGLDNGGGNGPGTGGAIYNVGALTLRSVTVTGNSAVGSGYSGGGYYDPSIVGAPGLGGGIYSAGGSLALEAGTVIGNNLAVGADNGATAQRGAIIIGGIGLGGGVYVASGTATLTGVTLSNNTAKGGNSGQFGGGGLGGALYVHGPGYGNSAGANSVTLSNCVLLSNAAQGGKGKGSGNDGGGAGGAVYVAGARGATVTMTGDTLSSNTAVGGSASGGAVYVDTYSTVTLRACTIIGNGAQTNNRKAVAEGGGLFIQSGAKMYLDSFTLANVINNTDSSGLNGSTANIDGSYTLIT